jgi:ribonuclease HII
MPGRKRGRAKVIVPTHRHERRLWNQGIGRVIGVDEVGVAPTSGAVVAAAVLMPTSSRRIKGVRDSKTLAPAQRERLAVLIRRSALAIGVGAASVAEIDRLNIYHATHLAMLRAVRRISGYDHVLVDGRASSASRTTSGRTPRSWMAMPCATRSRVPRSSPRWCETG